MREDLMSILKRSFNTSVMRVLTTVSLFLFAQSTFSQELTHQNKIDERLSYQNLEDRLEVFNFLAFGEGVDRLNIAESKFFTFRHYGKANISRGFYGALKTFGKIAVGRFFVNADHMSPSPSEGISFASYDRVEDILKDSDLVERFGEDFMRDFVADFAPEESCKRKSLIESNQVVRTIVFIKAIEGTDALDSDAEAAECYLGSFFYHAGLKGVEKLKNGALILPSNFGGYVPSLAHTFVFAWIFNSDIEPGMSKETVLRKLEAAYKETY